MSPVDAHLEKKEFPRSNRYDRDWMLDNQMGPNAVWLIEWLTEAMRITPGMRVLDLGCGRAMTSIFLAREFDARVWAADLWIDPDTNWRRIMEAGVADRVCPLRAEAHALPFARGFFDAIVSVDAYQYFGTDALYLGYLSGFLREGGELGMVVPGLMRPFDGSVPEHLTRPQAHGKAFWEDDCWSFKTADWWRELWSRTSRFEDVRVDTLPDGWRHWRDFEAALEASGKGIFPSEVEAIERDRGRYIGFIRGLARRTGRESVNLYDPSLGMRVGVQ
jgi:cyclopropane fatty-acyl-phospholipid synthase-like methyltransferase